MRDQLLEQGIITGKHGDVSEPKTGRVKIQWSFLRHRVCRKALQTLTGVGWSPRLDAILKAALSGRNSPLVDSRYLERPNSQTSVKSGEVHSYLEELYQTQAEWLPTEESSAFQFNLEDDDYESEINVISAHVNAGQAAEASETVRALPPGSMFEQWRQYAATREDPAGFRLFRQVWKSNFATKLIFRSGFMQSVCPVCLKHKLLIRMLSQDSNARLKQRQLYDRHLQSQYRDRQVYWTLRASARLRENIILIIFDGIDQAKFAWPRSRFLTGGNKEFSALHRPRLHIWGLLVHGIMAVLTVSHADVFKGGATAVELLAWTLTELTRMGTDLRDVSLYIQMDNTASSNKNNTLFAFLGALVGFGLVGSAYATFLRAGHTHEAGVNEFCMLGGGQLVLKSFYPLSDQDIDQWFSELAAWTKKRLYVAETIEDFIISFEHFIAKSRPHEPKKVVLPVEAVRDWKGYFQTMNRTIRGIAGQTAPHYFEFVKREGT